MKYILTLITVIYSSITLGADILPNSDITPGEINPVVTTSHVCTPGFTGGYWHNHVWYPKGMQPIRSIPVRNVSSKQKKLTFKQYGMGDNSRIVCSKGFEIDHLISLELGGSNSAANRWPQTYCRAVDSSGKEVIPSSAFDKDRLENALKTKVCSGQMSLQQAQLEIATDWVASYKKHILIQY